MKSFIRYPPRLRLTAALRFERPSHVFFAIPRHLSSSPPNPESAFSTGNGGNAGGSGGRSSSGDDTAGSKSSKGGTSFMTKFQVFVTSLYVFQSLYHRIAEENEKEDVELRVSDAFAASSMLSSAAGHAGSASTHSEAKAFSIQHEGRRIDICLLGDSPAARERGPVVVVNASTIASARPIAKEIVRTSGCVVACFTHAGLVVGGRGGGDGGKVVSPLAAPQTTVSIQHLLSDSAVGGSSGMNRWLHGSWSKSSGSSSGGGGSTQSSSEGGYSKETTSPSPHDGAAPARTPKTEGGGRGALSVSTFLSFWDGGLWPFWSSAELKRERLASDAIVTQFTRNSEPLMESILSSPPVPLTSPATSDWEASELVAVCRAIDADAVILLSTHYNWMATMKVALRNPGLVAGLVLVDPTLPSVVHGLGAWSSFSPKEAVRTLAPAPGDQVQRVGVGEGRLAMGSSSSPSLVKGAAAAAAKSSQLSNSGSSNSSSSSVSIQTDAIRRSWMSGLSHTARSARFSINDPTLSPLKGTTFGLYPLLHPSEWLTPSLLRVLAGGEEQAQKPETNPSSLKPQPANAVLTIPGEPVTTPPRRALDAVRSLPVFGCTMLDSAITHAEMVGGSCDSCGLPPTHSLISRYETQEQSLQAQISSSLPSLGFGSSESGVDGKGEKKTRLEATPLSHFSLNLPRAALFSSPTLHFDFVTAGTQSVLNQNTISQEKAVAKHFSSAAAAAAVSSSKKKGGSTTSGESSKAPAMESNAASSALTARDLDADSHEINAESKGEPPSSSPDVSARSGGQGGLLARFTEKVGLMKQSLSNGSLENASGLFRSVAHTGSASACGGNEFIRPASEAAAAAGYAKLVSDAQQSNVLRVLRSMAPDGGGEETRVHGDDDAAIREGAPVTASGKRSSKQSAHLDGIIFDPSFAEAFQGLQLHLSVSPTTPSSLPSHTSPGHVTPVPAHHRVERAGTWSSHTSSPNFELNVDPRQEWTHQHRESLLWENYVNSLCMSMASTLDVEEVKALSRAAFLNAGLKPTAAQGGSSSGSSWWGWIPSFGSSLSSTSHDSSVAIAAKHLISDESARDVLADAVNATTFSLIAPHASASLSAGGQLLDGSNASRKKEGLPPLLLLKHVQDDGGSKKEDSTQGTVLWKDSQRKVQGTSNSSLQALVNFRLSQGEYDWKCAPTLALLLAAGGVSEYDWDEARGSVAPNRPAAAATALSSSSSRPLAKLYYEAASLRDTPGAWSQDLLRYALCRAVAAACLGTHPLSYSSLELMEATEKLLVACNRRPQEVLSSATLVPTIAATSAPSTLPTLLSSLSRRSQSLESARAALQPHLWGIPFASLPRYAAVIDEKWSAEEFALNPLPLLSLSDVEHGKKKVTAEALAPSATGQARGAGPDDAARTSQRKTSPPIDLRSLPRIYQRAAGLLGLHWREDAVTGSVGSSHGGAGTLLAGAELVKEKESDKREMLLQGLLEAAPRPFVPAQGLLAWVKANVGSDATFFSQHRSKEGYLRPERDRAVQSEYPFPIIVLLTSLPDKRLAEREYGLPEVTPSVVLEPLSWKASVSPAQISCRATGQATPATVLARMQLQAQQKHLVSLWQWALPSAVVVLEPETDVHVNAALSRATQPLRRSSALKVDMSLAMMSKGLPLPHLETRVTSNTALANPSNELGAGGGAGGVQLPAGDLPLAMARERDCWTILADAASYGGPQPFRPPLPAVAHACRILVNSHKMDKAGNKALP